MATPAPPPPSAPPSHAIRISKVAERYLVFDLGDVMRLRRSHGLCSVLVGTTAQAPNQNVFSGLPLELLAEEVCLLLEKGVAVVVDETRAHIDRLTSLTPEQRRAYVDAHRARRAAAQRILEEESAARTRAVVKAGRIGGKKGKRRKQPAEAGSEATASPTAEAATVDPLLEEDYPEPELFGSHVALARESIAASSSKTATRPIFLTPTTSEDLRQADALLGSGAESATGDGDPRGEPAAPPSCPLHARLNSAGYFMTPGIRFGGRYSVYPGDPFRFHAHFIADSYGWDEEIDMLDLVGTGRLAGAVKKGLLIGAEDPTAEGAGDIDGKAVRAFSIEWAAM